LTDSSFMEKVTVVLIVIASTAAAFVIWLTWTSPLDSMAVQGDDSPDWFGGSALVALLGPAAVLAVAAKKRRISLVLAAGLVAPAVAAAVALAAHADLEHQREARHVFTAYTHRFPDGQLKHLDIRQRTVSC
jgi:hypothetical protein